MARGLNPFHKVRIKKNPVPWPRVPQSTVPPPGGLSSQALRPFPLPLGQRAGSWLPYFMERTLSLGVQAAVLYGTLGPKGASDRT